MDNIHVRSLKVLLEINKSQVYVSLSYQYLFTWIIIRQQSWFVFERMWFHRLDLFFILLPYVLHIDSFHITMSILIQQELNTYY